MELAGGRGYLEKDWGTAFPQAYVWMQSNHFEVPGVSLVASTALIPWRRAAFRGTGRPAHPGGAAGLRYTDYTRARSEVGSRSTTIGCVWSLRAPSRPPSNSRRRSAGGRPACMRRCAPRCTSSVLPRPSMAQSRSGCPMPREEALFAGQGQCAGVEVYGCDRTNCWRLPDGEGWGLWLSGHQHGQEGRTGSTPGAGSSSKAGSGGSNGQGGGHHRSPRWGGQHR